MSSVEDGILEDYSCLSCRSSAGSISATMKIEKIHGRRWDSAGLVSHLYLDFLFGLSVCLHSAVAHCRCFIQNEVLFKLSLETVKDTFNFPKAIIMATSGMPEATHQETSYVKGKASGRLLASNLELSFWGGINTQTGEIIDRHHLLGGQHLHGTILALPVVVTHALAVGLCWNYSSTAKDQGHLYLSGGMTF